MGKADAMTPKAIANKWKLKGLQKLRWYCQMCQKQCRDENGFKCHCASESHQRQMSLFAESPDKFVDEYSEAFEEGFLANLKMRHWTTRTLANVAYNEYIQDKEHIHMNSTMWETLTDFVKYLGRTGKCHVDETEKGWFVQFIHRDAASIARQESAARKEKQELDDEERAAKFIEQQLKEQESGSSDKKQEEEVDHTFVRSADSEAIKLSLVSASSSSSSSSALASSTSSSSSSSAIPKPRVVFEDDGVFAKPKSIASSSSASSSSASASESASIGSKRKLSELEQLIHEEKARKEKQNRKDYWVHTGIVVKVMASKLADGKYYKKKGVVKDVIDRYVAEIEMVDSGDVLRIDQDQLETVIPQPGGHVRIVNGAFRGMNGVMLEVDTEKFSCKVKIEGGLQSGRTELIAYEDLSKVA